MNEDEWAGKVHLRTAPKCCARCAYYAAGYEGEGRCEHPDAMLESGPGEEYWPAVSDYQVCDKFKQWKRKEKS